MPIIHAIVLGLVQGSPVPAHLVVRAPDHRPVVSAERLRQRQRAEAFDVALHIGTLAPCASIVTTWRCTSVRVAGAAQPGPQVTPEGHLAWLLLLATLPAAAVGAVFEKQIDEQLGRIPLIAVPDPLRPAAWLGRHPAGPAGGGGMVAAMPSSAPPKCSR
jgi:undecaprenyl-diphosphatase